MNSYLIEGTALCQQGASISDTLIKSIVTALFDPLSSDSEKKSFLDAFQKKGETIPEIEAFTTSLLEKAIPFPAQKTFKERPLFDCCGTGGGGLNLFNVSTAIVPIMASLGIPVVKHGNRGVTKKSGSADAIEALGIQIELTPHQALQCLEQVGCVFLLASHFHPHFKLIANIRKELGQEGKRTIFNLLGPLLNPARPQSQLLGVFKYEHLNLFHAILNHRKTDHTIVLGKTLDHVPLGEVSPWGNLDYVSSPSDLREVLSSLHLTCTKSTEPLESLLVSSAEESIRRIINVLEGKDRGLARDMVVINATVGVLTSQGAALFSEARQMVEESIDSGKALEKLRLWQNWRPL